MAVIEGRPGFLSRILHRGATSAPKPEAATAAASPPAAPATATETINTFARIAGEVQVIRMVVARSEGDHVDFIVAADGPWHEAIDQLEPKLHELIVGRGARLDYQVARPGVDADPVGYYPVFQRG